MNTTIAILPGLSALLCLGLGVFVFTRDRRHPTNIGFALGMFSLFFTEMGNSLSLLSEGDSWILFYKRISLGGLAFLPPTWLLFSLTFARTNYREALSHWKPALIGTSLLSVFFLLWIPSPRMIILPPDMAGSPLFILGSMGRYFYIYLLLGMVLNLIHLENTLRSSTGTDRWHIKYILIGVGGILSFQIYLSSQALLFSQLDPRYIAVRAAVILIAGGMMLFFMVRHRLLSVNIFISRYVIYNSLTVLFVGGYLLAVGLAAQTLKWLGGSWDVFWSILFSFTAILALVIIFLSTGFRRKAQLFVNRHFYKHKYEFRDKWMETTERIGTGTSLESIQKALMEMIHQTLGAKEIVLYLLDPETREFYKAESTFSFRDIRIREDHPFIQKMNQERDPFLLNPGPENENSTQHPDDLAALLVETRAVLCTPLMAGPEIVGFLLQGEDLSGIPYGTDDFEILKAISTQAAGQIRNIRLSRELLTAKEAEAFHQVSTFFIHDLKNLISTLSLLVQNAEEHLSNPSFQQDAMRTLRTTVAKMNAMVSKLTLLSRGLKMHPHPVLLNDLLEQTVTILNGQISPRIVKRLEKIPPVLADGEQVQKVVLNLLLNAIEASPSEGSIHLQTREENDKVILTVTDQGCGMAPDFIRSSLFKPFQTTKPQGLGIGLFQCKKIIEAHGGWIEVESELGRGTTFRVLLPVAK